jgi:chromosomal replication initiation ATPase DnaA
MPNTTEHTIEHKIEQLLATTEEIAQLVEQHAWDDVDQLARIRQESLEKFFASPVATENAQQVEQMIRKIMAKDKDVVELIKNERKQTFNNFAKLKTNSKANNAYKNVATLVIP